LAIAAMHDDVEFAVKRKPDQVAADGFHRSPPREVEMKNAGYLIPGV